MQANQAFGLQQAIFGTRSRKPEAGGHVEECIVRRVTAKGVYFTRPSFDNNKTLFGPAPYTWASAWVTGAGGADGHTHPIPVPTNGPTAGDRLLVVWVGAGEGNPWCVGWWPA